MIFEASQDEYQAARRLAQTAPQPSRFGNILCGTAGWTDPTLAKDTDFYPRGARAARTRLAHYAKHFPFVEVDATYYALLPVTYAHNWLLWTPETFTFDVKAYAALTGHPIDTLRLPADLRDAIRATGAGRRVYAERLPNEITEQIESRFRAFVEPLQDSGRLGAVLLQFPPWFTAQRSSVAHLERLAQRWANVPLAVEFRHASWTEAGQRQRTLDLLARHELSLVCVDAPQVGPPTAPPLAVTNPRLSIVRFHGRNVRGWAQKGATVHERFSYLYSSAELDDWIAPLGKLAAAAETVHATFNNCYRDYAILNAQGLAARLKTSG